MRKILASAPPILMVLVLAGLFASPASAQCALVPPAPPVCPTDMLLFAAPGAFGWAPGACAPPLYDVARGDLVAAWSTKNICFSTPICLPGEDDAAGLAAADALVLPPGTGFWYLSRSAVVGAPDFSWNEPGPNQAYDRDPLLAVCPL